jgi:hypothetical protein
MSRILQIAIVVCLVASSSNLVRADSLASTAAIAGNAEAPNGQDFDSGVVGSASVASDTDPDFGTASADVTVLGPSLSIFGFAGAFAGPPWVARGDALWSDVLRFSFPATSVTGIPEEILVEFVASFEWSIESNGHYGIALQNKSANFILPGGEQFDDFGNVPAGMSGFVDVSASVPFDSIETDQEDPTMLVGEVALYMQMDGGAGAGDHIHGSWPTASGEFNFDLVDIIVHGIEGDAEIESDSGESYDFEMATADFDDDSDVDGRDFLFWQRGFGITTGAELGDGDSNGDGSVDAIDLSVWHDQYGEPGHLAVASVPEPGSALLMGFASVAVFSRRKRRG